MKLLVFAGTKNGRLLVETLAQHNHKIYVSSISNHGASLIAKHSNIDCLIGKMNTEQIIEFIGQNDIDLMIDSTHPYAKEISLNLINASKVTHIDVIRFERRSTISSAEGLHFEDFNKALNYLKDTEGNILFTTGVNEVISMEEQLEVSRIFVRIVPMKSSIDKVKTTSIPLNQIIQKQPPYSLKENIDHVNEYNIKYLVTKDSGAEGNTKEKVIACKRLGIQLLVIDRPKISYNQSFYSSEEIIEFIS